MFEPADNAFDSWDFNEMIWQDTSRLDFNSLEWLTSDTPLNGQTMSAMAAPLATTVASTTAMGDMSQQYTPQSQSSLALRNCHPSDTASPASSVDLDGHALVEHFLASVVPPILASIEVGPRWTSTKMLFASLAGSSSMVRNAVMAFSALEIGTQDEAIRMEHKTLFDRAAEQLSHPLGLAAVSNPIKGLVIPVKELQFALATVFFLSYSALLTDRVDDANALLKGAARLIRPLQPSRLGLVEKRLISWLRLVDGRASSAGGDGAFLAETDDEAYSPDAHQKPLSDDNASSNPAFSVESEIEEILFDILYTPGLVFYQRVQSMMARISKIDPWHRTRGTVADETEVMSIAAIILKDLSCLATQRPALMDHAVAGTLSERYLAKDIAISITRSYRTYWANYEAAFIHLHRVAHKNLPATVEVIRARSTIKRIARLFEQSIDALPVNFIWPLLMACCEEDNLEDRIWMIQAIRNMQGLASNAKPIASVLEEVHRRQDATKHRADVRQTSMDLFNMSFAVV